MPLSILSTINRAAVARQFYKAPSGGGGGGVSPFFITGGFKSTDGVTWTALTNLPTQNTIYSWKSAYNPYANIYVFATNASYANITSNNGATWTTVATSTGTSREVAYGNGKFVIAGDTKMNYSSDNGATWNSCTPAIGFVSIYYSSYYNKFIAAISNSASSQFLYYSSDGITFTVGTISGFAGNSPGTSSNHIYGNESTGLLLATNNTSTSYFCSTDGGVNWTTKTGPFIASCVYYSPTKGYWILGAYSGGGGIATSTNPNAASPTWTIVSTAQSYVSSIFYSAYLNLFVLTGYGNPSGLATTPDLINYTLRLNPSSGGTYTNFSQAVVSNVAD